MGKPRVQYRIGVTILMAPQSGDGFRLLKKLGLGVYGEWGRLRRGKVRLRTLEKGGLGERV